MTIDEAIKHCEDVAERYERMEDSHDDKLREECLQCAADHRQLAEWLRDLRKAKRLLGEAMRALNDSSCNKDCRQCKWNNGGCEISCRFAWKYGDEAMKLLNKEAESNAGE